MSKEEISNVLPSCAPFYLGDSALETSSKLRFLERLTNEFTSSVEEVNEPEADFQRFVGEIHEMVPPVEFPECPIKLSFVEYCTDAEFVHLQTPLSSEKEIPNIRYRGSFPYGGIFIGLSVCYEIRPSFTRFPPQCCKDVPSSSQRQSDIARLITAMEEDQLTFVGKINAPLMMGLDFLGKIALSYGIFLEYEGKGAAGGLRKVIRILGTAGRLGM